MSENKTAILNAVERITENYRNEELFISKNGRNLPDRSAVIAIVRDLKSVIFPGYLGVETSARIFPEHYAGYWLNDLYDRKMCIRDSLTPAFYGVGRIRNNRDPYGWYC